MDKEKKNRVFGQIGMMIFAGLRRGDITFKEIDKEIKSIKKSAENFLSYAFYFENEYGFRHIDMKVTLLNGGYEKITGKRPKKR